MWASKPISLERRKYLRGKMKMREFLLEKGFKAETLALLNAENLKKLAAEYGFKN
jgi:hypothetical protein